MNQKSNLEEIDHKIEKLIQLQDLSTIQTVLLAILFAILIFTLTIILYYKDQNILVWLVSWIVLAYDFWMFYWLICSIFSGDYKSKFLYFDMTLFFLSVSGAITLVSLIFLGINLMFDYSIGVNHTIAVILLISAILITLILNRHLKRIVDERFDILLKEIKKQKKLYQGRFAFICKFIKKNIKNMLYSGSISILVTLLFGLWEQTSLRTSNESYYGIPFTWMIEYVDRVPSLDYNYYSIFGNWFIYTFIIFILLIIYTYLKKYLNGKGKSQSHSKRREIKQNIEDWQDDPHFVKYK